MEVFYYRMIIISDDIYRQFADALKKEIGGQDYVDKIDVVIKRDNIVYNLLVYQLSVYYEPCGANQECERVHDLIAGWWEIKTFDEDGQVLNNGNFGRIKKLIQA